jgi:energy-coupling factor transporter ATP-binding protein EcfA2
LSSIISFKYPHIAAEYLGVTDAIKPLSTLDEILESNYFDVPQNYRFLHREQELDNITKILRNNKIVLLYGKAGSGKTRLAIESARNLIKDGFCKDAYIFRRESILTLSKLNKPTKENYIIILDDINRMPSWSDFIEYSFHNKNIKLILTVRDYALENIKMELNKYSLGHLIDYQYVKTMNKEQVKEIIQPNVQSLSSDEMSEVLSVTKGNLRFTVMTAEIIKKNKRLPSNIEEIFDNYFMQISTDLNISASLKTKDEFIEYKKTLALIALLGKVVYRYEKNDSLPKVFSEFEINDDMFLDAVNYWNDKEFVNKKLSGRLIEISDQILSDYIFYKFVYLEGLLNINDIIKYMLKGNPRRLIDLLQSIVYIYGYNDVIKESIENTWKEIKELSSFEHQIKYLKIFSQLLPTEVLSFYYINIDKIQSEDFNVLSNYENLKSYEYALEILFLKFERSSIDEKKELAELIKKNFWIKQYSNANNYSSQIFLLKFIKDQISKESSLGDIFQNTILSFFSYTIEWNSWDDIKTLTLHNMKLTGNRYIYKLREILFDILFIMFDQNKIKTILLVKSLNNNFFDDLSQKINDKDIEILESKITDLNQNDFYDMAFLANLYISFLSKDKLDKHNFNDIFNTKISSIYFEFTKLSLRSYDVDRAKKTIIIFNKFLNIHDFIDYLPDFCKVELFDKWVLSTILEQYFKYLSSKDRDTLATFNDMIFNVPNISTQPIELITFLNEKHCKKSLLEIIDSSSLEEKDMWLTQLFTLYKKEDITEDLYSKAYNLMIDRYVENTPQNRWGNERITNFFEFEKYKSGFYRNIFIEVFKNIENGNNNGFGFVEDLYSYKNGYFNDKNQIDEKAINEIFGDKIKSLFVELYFLVIKNNANSIYSRPFLSYLITLDENYIYRYFDIMHKKCNANIEYRVINNTKNKVQVIKTIICNHIDSFEYILCNSIKNIFTIINQEETVDVLKHLISKYNNNKRKLFRIVELIGSFEKPIQIELNKFLVLAKISINIYNKLPLFFGPSSWSGSRIPIIIKQKEIAQRVIDDLPYNVKTSRYIEIIHSIVERFQQNIKYEELYDYTRDLG